MDEGYISYLISEDMYTREYGRREVSSMLSVKIYGKRTRRITYVTRIMSISTSYRMMLSVPIT